MNQPDFFTQEENNFQENTLPSMLNVLTILTFIGSAIALWGIYQIAIIDDQILKTEKEMVKLQQLGNEMPAFAIKALEDGMKLTKAQQANKIPLLVANVISFILCLWGAIKMRKLQMQGYYFYLIGEILPVAAMFILIGGVMFKGMVGITTSVMSVFFPLLFIILYTTQRKHLK